MNKELTLKVLDKYRNDYLSTQEDIEAFGYARECVKNGIVWHMYPEGKPRTNGRYLCVYSNGYLDFGRWLVQEWYVFDDDVEWWAELPDTPVCRRENAE